MEWNSTVHNVTIAPGPSPAVCDWPESGGDIANDVIIPTQWVEFICYPILLLICTLGNTLSFIVLIKEKPKTTTTVYLTCVVVSDLCVVWTYMSTYLQNVNPLPYSTEPPSLLMKQFLNSRGFITWWREFSICFSDWTLVLYSIERFLACSWPLRFGHGFGVKRAIMLEVMLLFLAMVFALENLVLYNYHLAHDDGVKTFPEIVGPQLVQWYRIQNNAEVGMTIAKWVFLALINCGIILTLTRHRAQSALLSGPRGISERKLKDYRSSNWILISSILLYFFTVGPNVVLKCLEIASKPPYCTFNYTPLIAVTAIPITNTFFLANYSLNFVIYIMVSHRFQQRIRKWVPVFRKQETVTRVAHLPSTQEMTVL